MKKENLTVCFFGIYNPEYSRNRVLIEGLRQNGVEVVECRSEKTGSLKYFDLIKKHWKIRKQYDVLFVAFPGFQTMILAKFLTRKKIIFDLFAPLYESEVLDRQNTKKGSLRARYYWWLDKFSAKLADKVLLDTNEHIKYFVEEFGFNQPVDGEKFTRIFVGTDETIFSPRENKTNEVEFIIHFHGSNISLQGIKYILESAKILEDKEDIKFNIIGTSIKEEYGGVKHKNINFIDNVPYEGLPEYIAQANVCLGIFGDTDKTQRVIPNKVYEYIACKKPVITADTPSVRELFSDDDLCLIPTANVEALIGAILNLKENSILREKIKENAYNKFIQNCTSRILGKQLINIINN